MNKKTKASKKNCRTEHPHHDYAIPRLKKIQGQLGGIESMIGDGRYCVDILVQFRAAMAALRNLEATVFETHLQHCVTHALTSSDRKDVEKKIKELTELLSRRTQL